MAKRPSFDLASLTAEAAEPMKEAVQRAATPAPTVPSDVEIKGQGRGPDLEAIKTANLEQLAFKVAPAFRKRFRQRAHDADLKLNELLFEALDAWEREKGIK